MSASYWDREAAYRKRIGIIVPIVAVLLVSAFLFSGRLEYHEVSRLVGWRGPIELLPEITVEPDVASPQSIPPPAGAEAPEAVALEVSDEPAFETGPPDLEPNPPRPFTQPLPQVDRLDVEAAPARPEVSYSDTYVILHMVKPTYPARELAEGIEGNVTVELLIDEQGMVAEAAVVSAMGPVSFQESTLEAVRQFRFQPMTENGRPTSMWIKFLVKFRIFA
jgi:protein TonB